MIQRLRKRFIRIAMLSVALVLLALTLIVNIANFVSTNRDINEMLDLIYEGPDPGTPVEKPQTGPETGRPMLPQEPPKGPFNQETPYSMRYFTLTLDADGTVADGDFTHIASVTQQSAIAYAAAALRHGKGYGFYSSSCKFLVTAQENGQYLAIFLDCYQQLRAVRMLAAWSGVSYAVCIALVYVLVVLLSRRAIDPVVQASERQKQFITDAGHELKTPITVIGTSLKVLEMEVGKQKWIDKARVQTEKLRELVQALITLCKYDEQTTLLHPQPFNVDEAVRDTVESFAELAQAKDCSLDISSLPELIFCGDEAAVRQLVSILLDNAVKYAVPDTVIHVSLEPLRRGVQLAVENDYVQPIDVPLDRLFDRFYRPDASRTAATGGLGIGLSIAKSIAEAHHGTICASTKENRITFTAELK